MRQLVELRRRLAAAEDTLAESLAAMKRAEAEYDAANDRFEAVDGALDAARAERAGAA